MNSKILLISDQAKTAAAVKQALPDYLLTETADRQSALQHCQADQPDLVILDHDLSAIDAVQLYRQIRLASPRTPVIMLSAANDIPLAVAVTRLGVVDFLKKPLVAEQLRQAVAKSLALKNADLPGPAAARWLRGDSPALKRFYEAAAEAVNPGPNVLLLAEPGINVRSAAEYLHARSARPRRKITTLDLASFNRADLEGSFWTTVQELMVEPAAGSSQSEEDRTGTLLLENIAVLEPGFQASIFAFLRERRGKIDREILAVIAAYDSGFLALADTGGFKAVEVPPLRRRKEDLPLLIVDLLAELTVKHNRTISGITAPALAALSLYDYPGNYRELRGLLENALLHTAGGTIGLKELPLDLAALIAIAEKRALAGGAGSLGAAKRLFEKELYETLAAKSGGEIGAVARFLDMPKGTLAERLEELRSYPLD
jgi:two-component system, NtrC family, response regulator HydG